MLNYWTTRRIAFCIIVFSALLGVTTTARSSTTINPASLIVDGGFTFNSGVSLTTQLFVDIAEPNGASQFWVRVEDNPGIPNDFGLVPPTVPGGADDGQTEAQLPEVAVYIKYFPLSRFFEVLSATRDIRTFGTVNPYVEGFVICDAPNSTVRIWNRTVVMAYNCGSDEADADDATFAAEALLKALSSETIADPDLQGSVPQ